MILADTLPTLIILCHFLAVPLPPTSPLPPSPLRLHNLWTTRFQHAWYLKEHLGSTWALLIEQFMLLTVRKKINEKVSILAKNTSDFDIFLKGKKMFILPIDHQQLSNKIFENALYRIFGIGIPYTEILNQLSITQESLETTTTCFYYPRESY